MVRLPFPPVCRPALLLAAACGWLAACTPPPPPEARTEPPLVELPANVKELTPEAAAAYISAHPGLLILDVRESWELPKEGRLPASTHVDYLGPQFAEEINRLDPKRPCLVYCAIGGRAKLTAVELAKRGFTDLAVLKGGLDAWLTEGRPVEK